MNLFTARDDPSAPKHYIHIVEPQPEDCEASALPPEGNVKLRNYRLLSENIRAYTPTGDVHTSPSKGKLVSRFDICSTISPPRAKILELLRPGDPGHDALEAIVRPAPRRGLTRPFDEDTRRFLQRAIQSPSPNLSTTSTPEPRQKSPESSQQLTEPETVRVAEDESSLKPKNPNAELSLADELKEAEEEERGGIRRELLREWRKRGARDAMERERLGRLALSVEEDESEECGLSATARRLDALLAESRDLHDELAEIHEDLQAQTARARRCALAARALSSEAQALHYLDDVVALLRGDVTNAATARRWPFALGSRQPGRNYII
ncbi:unnamed protein product [Arctia plantaginis]|uniref:Uncharacterized protein n=1 Tax=Arctia plantaginis TaxID=874455 RepID=A0A8S0ZIM7_ARCPL|nr:unnamed protein product [Arctia plantaginis]